LPDISKWDTSKVLDLSYMFYNCYSLKSLPDISKWDTGKVKSIDCFCYECKSLSSLPDISKWNLSNVDPDDDNIIIDRCEMLTEIPDFENKIMKKKI
jgi:surface protein